MMMQESGESTVNMSAFSRVIQDIQGCVAELRQDFEDGGGLPITDDQQSLHKLCVKLEYLFQSGLKQKSGLLGGKKDYWNYVSDCVSSNKGLNDGIHFVKGISSLKTNLGRGRALLRFCLVHQRLADTIQQCLTNPRITGEWYQSPAVWFQHAVVSELINSLYDLNNVNFDLDPRGHDLDAAWPTFARRNMGGGGSWRPPSRTTSTSSLSMANESENGAESLPSDAQQQDSVHVNKLQKECKVYKQRVEKMTEDQNQKDSAHEEQVGALNSRIKEMEDLMEEVNEHLDEQKSADTASSKTTEESKLQMIEMQGKIASLDKQKKALELKLQASEMTISAKDKVDKKKAQLIEMLDKKIAQMERENSEVHKSVDILLEDKKKLSVKLGEAAAQLEKMMKTITDSTKQRGLFQEENLKLKQSYTACETQLQQLVRTMEETDRMRTELERHNKELTKMLHELEDKSQKIGSMAKEKVLKFKNKAEIQQVEITTLHAEIQQREEQRTKMEARLHEVEEALAHSRGEVMGQVRQMIDTMDSSESNQAQFVLLGQKLDSLDEVSRSLSKEESLEVALKASETINTDIKSEMLKLKTELQTQETSVEGEREDLQAQLSQLQQENSKYKLDLQSKETQLHKVGTELNEVKAMLTASGSSDGGSDANKELANELQTKLEEIESLKQGLEALNDTKETRGRDLDRMVKLQAVNTELLGELKNKDEYLQDLIKQMHLMKKFMETYKAKVEKMEEMADASQMADKEPKTAALDEQLGHLVNTVLAGIPALPHHKMATDHTDSSAIMEPDDQLHHEVMQQEPSTDVMLPVSDRADMEQLRLQLEKKLSDEKEKCTDLHAQLSELKQYIAASAKKVQNLMSQQDESQKEHNVAIETLKQDCAKADSDILAERTRCGQLVDQLQQLKEGQSCLQLQLQESQKGCEHVGLLTGELHRLQEECERYDSDTRSLQLEVAGLMQDKAEFKLQIEDGQKREEKTNSDLVNLRKTVEVLTGVESMLQEQLDTREAEIKEMLIDNCKNSEDCDVAMESMQCLSSERDTLQQELLSGQTTVGDLQLQVKQLQEKVAVYELEAPIVGVEKENVALREQLQIIVTEKAAMCVGLTEKNAVLKEEVARLGSEVYGAAKESAMSDGKIQKLKDEVKKLTDESLGKSEAIDTFISNIDLMGKEVEKIRTEKKEKEEEYSLREIKMENMIESLKQDLITLKADKCKEQKELCTEKDGLEKEIQALKFQMSLEQMEHDEALKKYSESHSHMEQLQLQVTHQVAAMDEMEVELESLQKEREFEVATLTKGNENVREMSDKKNHEVSVLGIELRTTNSLLVKERSKATKLQAELDECHLREETMQAEISTLNSDIGELKKRLIQLIRDKDQLWQEKDRMEFERKLKSLETWMDSSAVTNCLACGSDFSILLRKHHCRVCGRIFCNSCCDNWALTPHNSQKVRVCSSCFMSNSQLEPTSDGGVDQDSADFLESVEIPIKRSSKWSQQDLDDEDSEEISPGHSPHHSSLLSSDHSFLPDVTGEISTLSVKPDELPVASAVEGSIEVSSRSYISVDGGLQVSPGSSVRSQERHISADLQSGLPTTTKREEKEDSPAKSADENFDIITSDEIEESALEPLADINTFTRETVTTAQIARGEELCEPDLWVTAGRSYAVPVLIDTQSTVLSWNFSTEPKGINFTVTYQENVYMGPGEVLIPSCKCSSHRVPVSGELVAKKLGLYTLIFDNTSSRFTAKKITYKLEVTLPDPES